MAPYLERIPRDALQHIAFAGASSSPLESIHHILHLLLTSSTIYRSLSIHACPQLYASIFRAKFDVPSVQNSFDKLTDSALATELVQRCRMLNRACGRDFVVKGLRQDLWTALWMALESNGLNEAQFVASGFSEFIILLLRCILGKSTPAGRHPTGLLDEIASLGILLLSLTLTQRDIINLSAETREELLNLLRPFTSPLSRAPVQNIQSRVVSVGRPTMRYNQQGATDAISYGFVSQSVIIYAERQSLTCPQPSSAAIALTFALRDATSFDIPTHLPSTRAEAIATQRPGPTIEDFYALARLRTPLYADAVSEGSGSVIHDSEFSGILDEMNNFYGSRKYTYVPGTLAGVWEGSYMMYGDLHPKHNDSQNPADFICRKPMQCVLSEHVRLRPPPPTPEGEPLALDPHRCSELEISPADTSITEQHPLLCNADVLEITLTGETLDHHEQAWGAFRFVGRIQQDGTITLKREPKNTGEDGLGAWTFEGHLRFDSVFVGQWKSNVDVDTGGIRGIFSLCKIVD
ncbi:hypothetical protein BD779DRAFT_418793 [Infundibulicybe gibba]|nr:hypothetical protein BD779DRAFT_418793 [Infundibulicybe gibba]